MAATVPFDRMIGLLGGSTHPNIFVLRRFFAGTRGCGAGDHHEGTLTHLEMILPSSPPSTPRAGLDFHNASHQARLLGRSTMGVAPYRAPITLSLDDVLMIMVAWFDSSCMMCVESSAMVVLRSVLGGSCASVGSPRCARLRRSGQSGGLLIGVCRNALVGLSGALLHMVE